MALPELLAAYPAAGVFYKRTDYYICTYLCRLNLFNKLAITVIDENTAPKA